MKKIVSYTVQYEDGTEEKIEGINGHIRSMELRSAGGSKQTPGKLFGIQMTASITKPVNERVNSGSVSESP